MTTWKRPETYTGGRTVQVLFEYGERSEADGILADGRWSQADTGEPFKAKPIAYAELPAVKLGPSAKVDQEALFGEGDALRIRVKAVIDRLNPTCSIGDERRAIIELIEIVGGRG